MRRSQTSIDGWTTGTLDTHVKVMHDVSTEVDDFVSIRFAKDIEASLISTVSMSSRFAAPIADADSTKK